MTDPVFFLVPEMMDDPLRVSGGNVYDAQVADGLRRIGVPLRTVRLRQRAGALAAELAGMPSEAVVLVDGLLVSAEPRAFAAESRRLRLLVLAHGPLSDGSDEEDEELLAFSGAERIVATSEWTRGMLVSSGGIAPERVFVARPGAEGGAVTSDSASGGRLLCSGVVAPHKGQDLLVDALAELAGVEGWTCTIVGSLTAAPEYVRSVRRAIDRAGLPGRIRLTGVLRREELEAEYGRADLLVHPSLAESYGMVVAEALAHGVPVLATRVGGIPEAVSHSEAVCLIPAGDGAALRDALRGWLQDPSLRRRMRDGARRAREEVRGWDGAVSVIAAVLDEAGRGAALAAGRAVAV
ncbi:glycosyltransferase family 4 protein [Microbacterium tumbae]